MMCVRSVLTMATVFVMPILWTLQVCSNSFFESCPSLCLLLHCMMYLSTVCETTPLFQKPSFLLVSFCHRATLPHFVMSPFFYRKSPHQAASTEWMRRIWPFALRQIFCMRTTRELVSQIAQCSLRKQQWYVLLLSTLLALAWCVIVCCNAPYCWTHAFLLMLKSRTQLRTLVRVPMASELQNERRRNVVVLSKVTWSLVRVVH